LLKLFLAAPLERQPTMLLVFVSHDCVCETGIHGTYFEVWERLPGSLGCRRAPAEAGRYLMHLRPRSTAWPTNTAPDDTLAAVVARHPRQADALLDFEIGFGTLEHGAWTIERATLLTLKDLAQICVLVQQSEHIALVHCHRLAQRWQVLEWHEVGAPI
jgi:hypothetical protein